MSALTMQHAYSDRFSQFFLAMTTCEHAHERKIPQPHRTALSALLTLWYCWLLALRWAADALRPINWRRSRAKCAAERRVVTSRSADRLKLLASGSVSAPLLLSRFPAAFLLRDPFYFGFFQFPCLFQSSRDSFFLVLPR